MSGTEEDAKADGAEKRDRSEDENGSDDDDAGQPPAKVIKLDDVEPPTEEQETGAPAAPQGEEGGATAADAAVHPATDDAAPAATPAEGPSPEEQDGGAPTEAGAEAEAQAEAAVPPPSAPSDTVGSAEEAQANEAAVPAGPPAVSVSTLPSGLPPGLPGATAVPQPAGASVVAAANPNADPDATVEEKGEVSALYVGRVIGKGGEMIRDLQARSGCRIDVDQNVPPGQPRLITYRGSRRTVDFAKRLVYMLCQENVNEADLPLGDARREFLVVPANSVGKIIGRGGEMIRELQSRSQAKIQVDHSGASGLQPTDKHVTITGTDQSVVKAKEMVLFLVANPLMDAMQSLNMLVEDKVQRGGVWGSGPPYPNLPQLGVNMQPGGGGYGYDQPIYGGAQPGAAPGYGGQGQYAAPAAFGLAATPAYQQPPVAAAYGGGVESEVFFAAKTFMGRIIGSKGVTINDLQKRSGCDIQINQDVPPGRDCEITLRGARQGIEMVKQMLREIIEIGPNHPYAGGGAGGGGGGGGGGQSYGGYQQAGFGNQAVQQQPYGYAAQGGYGQQQQQYGQVYGQSAGYPGAPQAQQYSQGGPVQQQQYQAPQQLYGSAPGASEWKAATAPDGQVYYYNERTGETTWTKPPGML